MIEVEKIVNEELIRSFLVKNSSKDKFDYILVEVSQIKTV